MRHTPEPIRIRLAMSALLLLGAVTGLLGALLQLSSQHLQVGPGTAGNFFLLLAIGMLVGRIAATRLLNRDGPGLRSLLLASSFASALSLISLSLIVEGRWIPLGLALLGMGVGGFTSGVAWLLDGSLAVHRTPAVMNLAGVSFGAGAVLICGFLWLFHGAFSIPVLERVLAAFPLLYAYFVWRNDYLIHIRMPAIDGDLSWRETLTPSAILLTLALAFQAANHWILGGWLAVYVSRHVGATGSQSLAALALFWLALICARVGATRLPHLEQGVRYLVAASLACCLGAVFLLQAVEVSGAYVGAILLGLGVGALHPLTIGNIARRFQSYRPGWINGLFSLSFAGGALAAWLVGPLSSRFGIEVILWAVLAGSLAVWVLLSIVIVETRLEASAEPA